MGVAVRIRPARCSRASAARRGASRAVRTDPAWNGSGLTLSAPATAAGRPSPRGTPARLARRGVTRAPLRGGRGFLERAGAEDARDLLAVEGLALEERPGEGVELLEVLLEDLARAGGALEDDALDLGVDGERGLLAVVLLAGDLPSEEDVLLVLAERERPEPVGHPPLAHHLWGHLGRLLAGGPVAGRLLGVEEVLGRAPPQ